jgi:hypothetical protein
MISIELQIEKVRKRQKVRSVSIRPALMDCWTNRNPFQLVISHQKGK